MLLFHGYPKVSELSRHGDLHETLCSTYVQLYSTAWRTHEENMCAFTVKYTVTTSYDYLEELDPCIH